MRDDVALEPLTEADLTWAWKIYNDTTREHIELAVGWSEERQYAERSATILGGHCQAIVDQSGRRVGLIETTDDGSELTIRHLELLPEVQGRGLGTRLVHAITARAEAAGQTVVLRVLRTNPPAQVFYERLGFVAEEERASSTQMRWEPAQH